mgnify:FL=1
MVKNNRRLRVLLDTNILISAFQFGGTPFYVFEYILSKRVVGITSEELLAELLGVFQRKFQLDRDTLTLITKKVRRAIRMVAPTVSLDVLNDVDDNRVLEATITGHCDYIVTGDTDLLNLKQFRGIAVVTPAEFLKIVDDRNV